MRRASKGKAKLCLGTNVNWGTSILVKAVMEKVRSLIVTVLGHVDHGKTTLLDRIRGTAIALKEPGRITQHIGATFIPAETLVEIAKPLIKRFKVEVQIPGFLVIDTPGHELFANLRRRGGAIADMAILVIDVMEGVQPQTIESIDILRARKTPFVVAANKVDLIRGWGASGDKTMLRALERKTGLTKRLFDEKIYGLIGQLSELGFESDLYFKISDFRRKVAIVPISAKTGEGLPDLIVVLLGLAQRYMMERLLVKAPLGKGAIIEVKEEPGMGKTADVIIYEGTIKVGDTVVVGTLEGSIVTRVKGLFQPMPLDEMRAPRKKFRTVSGVEGAAGVKVVLQEAESIVAGAPIQVVTEEEIERVRREIEAEMQRILVKTDKVGVIVKADSLGSLEALVDYLTRKDIPIRYAEIGDISKKNVVDASVVREKAEEYSCVLGFNVKVLPDAEEEAKIQGVPLVVDSIIYRLVERYEEILEEVERRRKEERLKALPSPAKIQILRGYVFRRSKPAIVGVEILEGTLRPGVNLMNVEGNRVGSILQIQLEGKPVEKATRGDRVAISIKGPTVGRQVKEDDVLFTDIPLNRILEIDKEQLEELTEEERRVLTEIRSIKSKRVMRRLG